MMATRAKRSKMVISTTPHEIRWMPRLCCHSQKMLEYRISYFKLPIFDPWLLRSEEAFGVCLHEWQQKSMLLCGLLTTMSSLIFVFVL